MHSTQRAFAQAIEVQRVRAGLRKSEVAQSAGLSPASLSKRLSGLVPLDTEDIERIAAALGLSPVDLTRLALEEQERASSPAA